MDASGANSDDHMVPPIEGVAGGGTAYGWNDGGSDNLRCPRNSIDPTEVPSTDLVHVWCMPSTANVGLQEIPRQLEPINLLAARNERESFQIAIRPKVSWGTSCNAGTVQIQCSDLISISGDRLAVGQSLTLRKVVPILGIPDALVPLDIPISQMCLFPGETTSIWISTDVPYEQPPGLYEGEILITALKTETETYLQQCGKTVKEDVYMVLKNCIDVIGQIDVNPSDEMVERVKSSSESLKRLLVSSSFSEFASVNYPTDAMDEDAIYNLSVRVKINLTVWDFRLPTTPSLPAVFGVSDTVIEDRFNVKHGTEEWYDALEEQFKWLLGYRISPFFCRWGQSMRVLAYTCPWPADHPKADEFYSDERLAAYAVPYTQAVISKGGSGDYWQKEIQILRTKPHWKKAYLYLWDEPLHLEHYETLRNMAATIHAYAPDARILTTYYCGPSDAPLASTPFESFTNVPNFLRPHTQIYCTSEWVLGNREDLAEDIIAELQPENGEEWWSYVCMGPTDPHPNWHLGMRGTQHRAVMWRVYKEGGTGFLYWGANCYEKATSPSAEIKFRRGLPMGDGVLYYPGEVFSPSHVPVASLRLERLLSGLQDIEYLKLYESRYGREESLALLARSGVYYGPERYTLDHISIDMMRGEIFSRWRT